MSFTLSTTSERLRIRVCVDTSILFDTRQSSTPRMWYTTRPSSSKRFGGQPPTILCQNLTSLCSAANPKARLLILPASMLSSKLTYPADAAGFTRPSKNLWALCLLPDVYTLGLPSYHNRPECQEVALAAAYIKNAIPQPESARAVTDLTLERLWGTERPGGPKAISEDDFFTGPVF